MSSNLSLTSISFLKTTFKASEEVLNFLSVFEQKGAEASTKITGVFSTEAKKVNASVFRIYDGIMADKSDGKSEAKTVIATWQQLDEYCQACLDYSAAAKKAKAAWGYGSSQQPASSQPAALFPDYALASEAEKNKIVKAEANYHFQNNPEKAAYEAAVKAENYVNILENCLIRLYDRMVTLKAAEKAAVEAEAAFKAASEAAAAAEASKKPEAAKKAAEAGIIKDEKAAALKAASEFIIYSAA